MSNYYKLCWYCGAKDLKDMGEYVLCRACQATYNDIPQPGSSPVTVVDIETGRSPRGGRETSYRPSGHSVRRARKERELPRSKTRPKETARHT